MNRCKRSGLRLESGPSTIRPPSVQDGLNTPSTTRESQFQSKSQDMAVHVRHRLEFGGMLRIGRAKLCFFVKSRGHAGGNSLSQNAVRPRELAWSLSEATSEKKRVKSVLLICSVGEPRVFSRWFVSSLGEEFSPRYPPMM